MRNSIDDRLVNDAVLEVAQQITNWKGGGICVRPFVPPIQLAVHIGECERGDKRGERIWSGGVGATIRFAEVCAWAREQTFASTLFAWGVENEENLAVERICAPST